MTDGQQFDDVTDVSSCNLKCLLEINLVMEESVDKCSAPVTSEKISVSADVRDILAARRGSLDDSQSPNMDEYVTNYSFCWMPPLSEYVLESSAPSQNAVHKRNYLRDLTADTNFYNPSAIADMAQAYLVGGLFQSLLPNLSVSSVADWDYTDVKKRQNQYLSHQKVAEGIAKSKKENYEEAFVLFSEALSLFPSADAYVARGALYANVGALLLAAEDFRAALSVDPTDANAIAYLDATVAKLGNFNIPATMKDADEYMQRLDSGAPSSCSENDGDRRSGTKRSLHESDERWTDHSRNEALEMSEKDDSSSSTCSSDSNSDKSKERKNRKNREKSDDGRKHEKDRKHKNNSKKKKKDKDKKRHKKSDNRKKKKRRYDSEKIRSSGTPLLSRASSGAEPNIGMYQADADADIHPILQRKAHRLWG